MINNVPPRQTARVKVSKAVQRSFFSEIRLKSKTNWDILAKHIGVSGRTMRDWARAKYFVPLNSYQILSRQFGVELPKRFHLLSPFWYVTKGARKGALKRLELYGPPGNRDSRRQGGVMSQKRRREEPEKYRLLGCIVKKDFPTPTYSEEFAEMVGIILGDGAINNYQIRISLDRKVDREYAYFVGNLMERVFGERPSWIERDDNTISLTLSGAGLVEMLEKIGLHRGNKVKNQVAFPEWVLKERIYRIACTRGLFDTDGGLYFHRHRKWKDKRPYLGWNFTNYSRPLIGGVRETLLMCGLESAEIDKKQLYMYSLDKIVRYFQVIGSSNPKNWEKLRYYIGIRKSAKVVSKQYKNLWRGAPNGKAHAWKA